QSKTERQVNRKVLWPLIGSLILAGLSASIAFGNNGGRNNKTFEYTIGLWGDLPYSDVQALTGVPNLIADMNDSDIEFSVHDGDLKAGSGVAGSATPSDCGDALYVQGMGYLKALKKPATCTPGDNDWTDCERLANGGFKSLQRLD